MLFIGDIKLGVCLLSVKTHWLFSERRRKKTKRLLIKRSFFERIIFLSKISPFWVLDRLQRFFVQYVKCNLFNIRIYRVSQHCSPLTNPKRAVNLQPEKWDNVSCTAVSSHKSGLLWKRLDQFWFYLTKSRAHLCSPRYMHFRTIFTFNLKISSKFFLIFDRQVATFRSHNICSLYLKFFQIIRYIKWLLSFQNVGLYFLLKRRKGGGVREKRIRIGRVEKEWGKGGFVSHQCLLWICFVWKSVTTL